MVRWRCCDLRDGIARHFGVKMHARTVAKLLARLNFSRVSVRPRHPGQDITARQAHERTLPGSSAPSFPSTPGTSRSISGGKSEPGQKTVRGTVFPANARVGQQGSLTCVRAGRGSRPRAPHDQRYTSACLFGALCPARGVGAARVLPAVNIAAMNPAPGRDQLPGSSRRPCRHHARHHARRRGLASTGRRPRRARQHQPAALAAVFASPGSSPG